MESAPRLRFSVVTSSDLESGTTIAYLIEATGIRVQSIYLDAMQQFSIPKPGALHGQQARWFRDWEAARMHFGLARSMPRHYVFTALEKLAGVNELQFLYWLERASPGLLQRYCGFPLPKSPMDQPLLRKLTDVTKQYDIPLIRTPSLNSDETVAALRAEPPDVVIGLGTRILSSRLLSTARIGFLNGHSSLLPDYRGGAAEFWQLAYGERETGVTIHWMAPKVDEGAICTTKRWSIPQGFDHHRLRLLSIFNRLEAWREVVARLLTGELPRLPQREARTPTFRAPSMKQQFDFYRRGIRPQP
jgi:hypothetical protein